MKQSNERSSARVAMGLVGSFVLALFVATRAVADDHGVVVRRSVVVRRAGPAARGAAGFCGWRCHRLRRFSVSHGGFGVRVRVRL